jgi:hypothetical protein
MVWMKRTWIGTIDELRNIEAWFGTDDPEELAARYDDSLRALDSEDVEAWMAEGARANVSSDAMDHFRADWLEGTTIPGVDRGTLESALHDGFTAAITAARANGLKMSILWVMLGSGPQAFGIDHLVGPNAVTVVISVPTETTAATNAAALSDGSAS